ATAAGQYDATRAPLPAPASHPVSQSRFWPLPCLKCGLWRQFPGRCRRGGGRWIRSEPRSDPVNPSVSAAAWRLLCKRVLVKGGGELFEQGSHFFIAHLLKIYVPL